MKDLKTLNTENGAYETTFTKEYEQQKPWERLNPKAILSFIPGTITTVEVSVGQSVKVGDTLVTFNAMKMNNTFKSPLMGKIAKINVSAGDAVPKGVVLIEFE